MPFKAILAAKNSQIIWLKIVIPDKIFILS